jgi:Holliday junction resolvase RusA-like endonuclease
MKYTLKGKPVPLKRPRFSSVSTHKAYDPQTRLKEDSRIELRLQHGYTRLLTNPLRLNITFFMPIPSSISKKKQKELDKTPHFKRPDLSNFIKYVEDVAQGIIFKDDSCITTINAKKVYSTNPRTEFTLVEELNEREKNPQS